jgi:hypothetical protein
MDVELPSSVVVAVGAATAPVPEEAATLVLKKASDLRTSPAAKLVQSLPQQPLLATSGAVGTQVDTFA